MYCIYEIKTVKNDSTRLGERFATVTDIESGEVYPADVDESQPRTGFFMLDSGLYRINKSEKLPYDVTTSKGDVIKAGTLVKEGTQCKRTRRAVAASASDMKSILEMKAMTMAMTM